MSYCSLASHKSSSRFFGDVVNGSVVVKLVIENYTEELYSFGQRDGAASNTDGTHCPIPIPGEHDDFSFECAYVESFGVAPFLYSVDGFLRTLPNDPCFTSFG